MLWVALGGALGAALVARYGLDNAKRRVERPDRMRGSYLGPRYGPGDIRAQLDAQGSVYQELDDEALMPSLAEILDAGHVVGWFQGRMEFGPRALGARSIIGDPRSTKMQSVMNLKIKYRESFRPFAPSILAERVADYFDQDRPAPTCCWSRR